MADVEARGQYTSRSSEVIARIRAGTVIPPNAETFLYAAFIAKGDVLTHDEVDEVFAEARRVHEEETVSFPLIGGRDDA